MKKNQHLSQLIELLNEKLAVQAATIRHLNTELAKHLNTDPIGKWSLLSVDIGDQVLLYRERYQVMMRSRATEEVTLRLIEGSTSDA